MRGTCHAHLTLLDMIKLHTIKLLTNTLLDPPVTSPPKQSPLSALCSKRKKPGFTPTTGLL